MTHTRPTFTPEFFLEAAQLVTEQGYTIKAAATAMNVGKSTMDKWIRQLKAEHNGIVGKAMPLTPNQHKIRELEQIYHATTGRPTGCWPLFLSRQVMHLLVESKLCLLWLASFCIQNEV